MEDYHSEEPGSGDPCFYYPIPGGLLDKDVIEITGYFYGKQILIEILAESYLEDGINTALPLQFQLTSTGEWTVLTYSKTVPKQQQNGTVKSDNNFQIRIVSFENYFEIYLNNTKLCTQKHLIPLPQVSHLSIDGEAEFTGVEFKDLYSENDNSSHSSSSSKDSGKEYSVPAEVAPGFTRLSENRRSSNRKPKPPVLIPTGNGSLRVKSQLEAHQENGHSRSSSLSSRGAGHRNEINEFNIHTKSSTQPVHATPDLDGFGAGVVGSGVAGATAMGVSRTSSTASSPRRHISTPASGRESKMKDFKNRLFKRGSRSTPKGSAKGSTPNISSVHMNDVYVEEGSMERSVDGPGALEISAAASTPNLHQAPPTKEKKKFGTLFSRKDKQKKGRSASSPPTHSSHSNEQDGKKKRHRPAIFSRSKDRKISGEGKEKKHFKLGLGRKGAKGAAASGTAVVAGSGVGSSEYEQIEDFHTGAGVVPGTKLHSGTSSSNTSRSNSRSANHSMSEGSRNIIHATGGMEFQHAAPPGEARSRSSSITSRSNSAGGRSHSSDSSRGRHGRVAVAGRRLESATSSSTSRSRSPRSGSVSTSSSRDNVAGRSSKLQQKDMKKKLKGDSPNIASSLTGNKSLSNSQGPYTSTNETVPLQLDQNHLLSTGGGIGLGLGPKGSYDLDKEYRSESGRYEKRDSDDDFRISESNAVNVQHSMPSFDEPAVTAGVAAASPKKKHLLKGDSPEIASNLVDVDVNRRRSLSSSGGSPYTGHKTLSVPLKLNDSNRTAQPVIIAGHHGSRSNSRSSRSSRSGSLRRHSSRSSVTSRSVSHARSHSSHSESDEDMKLAIAASLQDNVHAAAPSIDTHESLEFSGDLKSATLPSADIGSSGGLAGTAVAGGAVAGGVVMRDKKDKKRRTFSRGKDKSAEPVDGEKPRKRDRVSNFFKRVFHRKRKDSQGNDIPGASSDDDGHRDTSQPEMTEKRSHHSRSSSRSSASEFAASAKPSEPCRYAAQLRGDRPALEGNFPVSSLCGDMDPIMHPLRISAGDVPANFDVHSGAKHDDMLINAADQNLEFAAPPVPVVVTNRAHSVSSNSSYSISAGGRRHHKKSRKHREGSLSSASSFSMSAGGTKHWHHRKQRHGSVSSGSSFTLSAGGSKHRRHHRRARARSVSSGSSFSESLGGTRHRRHHKMHRDGSVSSGSSFTVSIGGSRHRRHHKIRRGGSASSNSSYSVSAGGSRRRRTRMAVKGKGHGRHGSMSSNSSMERGFKQNGAMDPFSPQLINISQNNSAMVHSAPPRSHSSSSESSISEDGGHVIIIGESRDFQRRMQSFRRRMESPTKSKKSRKSRGESGSESDTSTSSISSIDSARLPPNVIKLKSGRAYSNSHDHATRQQMDMRF